MAAATAAVAVVWLLRRRALAPLPVHRGYPLLALLYITRQGSPWADAKALAITAPAVLLVVLLGPVALDRWGLRIPAVLVGFALAGGVLASNVMIYRDVSLSPHDRFEELADIGDRLSRHRSNSLHRVRGVRQYFLREGQPVGASEAFAVPGLSPLYTDGARPEFAREADLAQPAAEAMSIASPRSSSGGRRSTQRPPLDYELSWRGRFYDVWTRRGESRITICGGPPQGGRGSAADCDAIERFAADASSP